MHKTTAMRVVVIAAFAWNLSSAGEAATTQVDCSVASLQSAVNTAKPGDTLLVSGKCDENVVIPFEVVRITLDGQGKATINSQTASEPCILVNGRGITIKGFTITGGRGGIWVFGGGQAATIDGNTIQSGEVNGILVHRSSSAVIVNNTIQNARRIAGIQVNGNSFAFIGVLSGLDKVARPNIIQNNAHGINVFRSSSARIVGNTLSNNRGYGVIISRGSHAEIAGNKIDANGKGGVAIVRGAGADLGSDRGKRIFDQSNKTIAKNGGFGIRCSRGGYVGGRLGTLDGTEGEKNFDEGCVDSLKR